MVRARARRWAWASVVTVACTRTGTVGVVTGSAATANDDEGVVGSDDGDSGLALDVGGGSCSPRDEFDEILPCEQQAPADAFEPAEQWAWTGVGADVHSYVTPLVANLTDDNDDDRVDVCDTPDVVVVAAPPLPDNPALGPMPGHIHVLDGATGKLHFTIADDVSPMFTPALGDLDGDGAIEIVAVRDETTDAGEFVGRLVAFARDGAPLWSGQSTFAAADRGAVALADLDGDGHGEIMVAGQVADFRGHELVQIAGITDEIPVAADLDVDGDGEVVWGRVAHHHDGTELYAAEIRAGFAVVADFDADGQPDVVVSNAGGLTMIGRGGMIVGAAEQRPLPDVPEGNTTWRRPAAVHDLDGDGAPELVMGVDTELAAFGWDAGAQSFTRRWSAAIADPTGAACGGAFAFLGDGRAQAMIADETELRVFDLGSGQLAPIVRTSMTIQELAVVADIDRDGSAEIVVVSNRNLAGELAPTVRAFGDAFSRWVPARRIWNQHAYHVTNIDESGSLPLRERPSWARINTFRTNAQIEGGVVCVPEP
ncbi:MAG TPA: VCBS repeat-containing protein [Nannocystaceae bacterium]|nr:VCBS repeat-containing protein [Nannocystaceae bacterium]